jgi:lysophospholipase L1-like esterase
MWKASISRYLILSVLFSSMLFYAAGAGAFQAVTTDAAQPGAVVVAPQPASVTPVPRQGQWMRRHESMNNRVKQGDVDLLFIGDSITQGWEGAGKEVWKIYYDKRNTVNLGISGDQTQHVLWRLENGNIEGISPKLAVIMIGTNNASAKHKPDDIVAGVRAIVEKLSDKLPQTKILVLGIFPRGEDDKNPIRQVNMKANEGIAKLADGKMILYMDIGDKFLDPDRKLSKEIMPDRLHLSPKGYTIWAEAIESEIVKLMGEDK